MCREQTQCAVFVVELAAVQVSLTAEAFQACSKQSLASSLLHSRADIPRVSTTFSVWGAIICRQHVAGTEAGG